MGNYFAKLLPSGHYLPAKTGLITTQGISKFEAIVSIFFNKKSAVYTANGREAISIAFNTLNLELGDEIYITTSFNYKNVSSCVTSTVFNYCKPSRVLSKDTKAIFIIHEFGAFHPDTLKLIEYAKQHKIPVVEDCAHTIYSFDGNNNQTGCLGDFTIVSLPKVFPIQTGGFLVSGADLQPLSLKFSDKQLNDALIASELWGSIIDIAEKRKLFFNAYLSTINSHYFKPLIENTTGLFPWFFPIITTANPAEAVQKLRAFGIEAGLWHGDNVIVIPLHQNLNLELIQKICTIIKLYNQ